MGVGARKRPPCVKGAVSEADWGIDLINPLRLAKLASSPFFKGSQGVPQLLTADELLCNR